MRQDVDIRYVVTSMEGSAQHLSSNEDVKEFYLGISSGARRSFRETKNYRRRKRWLA